MRLFEGTPWDRPPRCERCGELEAECTCPPPAKVWTDPAKQTAKLAIEKRKSGKMVTIVRGLSPEESDLPALLKTLKTACSCGGTLKENEIEIQGDQRAALRKELEKIGYRVKGM